MDMTTTLRRTLLLIALVFFIGTVFVLGNGIRAADQLEDMLRETNAELLAAQVAVRAQENHPRLSVQEIAEVAYSIFEIGSMVADIQNRIMDYLSNSDFDAYHAAIMPLQTLFTSRPYTEMWFPLEAGLAVWTFETIYDIRRERIPVLWSLRTTEQNNLVALVHGVYDVTESRFMDLTMHITRYLSTLVGVSPGEYIPDTEIEEGAVDGS